MKPKSYPTWLSRVQEIAKSSATSQAFAALKNATTPDELAIAERNATATVLADIAAEMAHQGSCINIPGFRDNPNPTLLESLDSPKSAK